MQGRKASSSFFEKKEPKKLFSPGARVASSARLMDKSFLGPFFSKKGLLAFLPLAFLSQAQADA
jgi:hypothetical protein